MYDDVGIVLKDDVVMNEWKNLQDLLKYFIIFSIFILENTFYDVTYKFNFCSIT